MHYLLQLWSRMVAATPYFKAEPGVPAGKQDPLLEKYIPQVRLFPVCVRVLSLAAHSGSRS